MEGVPLIKVKTCNYKPDLCIICQKKTKLKPSSADTGRKIIIDAANSKQNEVYERLQNLTVRLSHELSGKRKLPFT